MRAVWKEYFNQYNPRGSSLEILEISLNSTTPSGVSIKVNLKHKSGKEKNAWIDLGWFDISKFPKDKNLFVLIPLSDIEFNS